MVKDRVHDFFGHCSDIRKLLFLTDIKRLHENPFDTNSLFKHQIKIRNLELEILSYFGLARLLSWDLVKESFHQPTNNHSLLLCQNLVLFTAWGVIAAKFLKHVLDSHELYKEGIMKFFVLSLDGVILSTVEVIVLGAINDWEVGCVHQLRELGLTGSKMLMSQLAVFDDSFTDLLEEIKRLFLWSYSINLIRQLVEVEHLVNESQSTLDIVSEFIVALFFEVDLFAFYLILSSFKLVSELLDLLGQLGNFDILLRIIATFFINPHKFHLCLQLDIFFFFDAELSLQVVDFCVFFLDYLLVIEQTGLLLKQSLFRLEFIELLFSLSNDGCFSFSDLRKSLTFGEERLNVA